MKRKILSFLLAFTILSTYATPIAFADEISNEEVVIENIEENDTLTDSDEVDLGNEDLDGENEQISSSEGEENNSEEKEEDKDDTVLEGSTEPSEEADDTLSSGESEDNEDNEENEEVADKGIEDAEDTEGQEGQEDDTLPTDTDNKTDPSENDTEGSEGQEGNNPPTDIDNETDPSQDDTEGQEGNTSSSDTDSSDELTEGIEEGSENEGKEEDLDNSPADTENTEDEENPEDMENPEDTENPEDAENPEDMENPEEEQPIEEVVEKREPLIFKTSGGLSLSRTSDGLIAASNYSSVNRTGLDVVLIGVEVQPINGWEMVGREVDFKNMLADTYLFRLTVNGQTIVKEGYTDIRNPSIFFDGEEINIPVCLEMGPFRDSLAEGLFTFSLVFQEIIREEVVEDIEEKNEDIDLFDDPELTDTEENGENEEENQDVNSSEEVDEVVEDKKKDDVYSLSEDTEIIRIEGGNNLSFILNENIVDIDTPSSGNLPIELYYNNGKHFNNINLFLLQIKTQLSNRIIEKNEKVIIDYTNAEKGYVVVKWLDLSFDKKIALRVVNPDGTMNTYFTTVENPVVTLPLTGGNGDYIIKVYQSTGNGDKYTVVLNLSLSDIEMVSEFSPFLHSNHYVSFSKGSKAVKIANFLCEGLSKNSDKINVILNYIVDNMEYAREFAEEIEKGNMKNYYSNVDAVLESGKGVCVDYAALMTAMLRSQGIPTKLEVGYIGSSYHAWVVVYSEEKGWVRYDPTLIDSGKNSQSIVDYIENDDNYKTTLVY